jgi:hypothetical protein
MTLTPHPDSDILHELGAGFARAGHSKPDFASWSLTYGAGTGVATAHRAFCRGFDAVRA